MKCLLLAAMLVPAAFAQFALYQVDGNVEHPVGAVLDLGSVYPTELAAAHFRIRNVSTAPATLTLLAVQGTSFGLSGAPALPAGLAPQQAVEFAVAFQGTTVASYSAALDADGIAVLLTASVLPRLTFQVGAATLSAGGLDFGSVPTGASGSRRVTVTNLTGLTLALPGIAAAGEGFSIPQLPPSGALLQPSDSLQFDVLFQPPGVGTWTGTLAIGDRSYPLSGTAAGPPLPRPVLAIELPNARSGEQGSISVGLDAAANGAGAGTLTLDFQPLPKGASDPAIQLGVMGRSLSFTIAAGDTTVRFGDLTAVAFQSGTTAGTIAIAVELGGATDRKTMVIPPSSVSILSAQATRSAAGIDLRVTGFDNTRSAGPITYTFYDTAGNALAPISADYTADFASFFAGSDQGGAFALRSVFPVTGDASKIAEFAVQMTNLTGTATTGRVKF
jgi:hypothetical protein